MTLFLSEETVSRLLTMQDALEAVEEVFSEAGKGGAVNVPRVRAQLRDGILRVTAGVLGYRGYYGVKISSTSVFGRSSGRLFCLYKDGNGELVALVQVFGLGALRTGAASGIATKYMANEDASILGVIGAGRQAHTQVDAISRVRPIREVRVFSKTKERCERFCHDLSEQLGLKVYAVVDAREAVEGVHIVTTATTATNPVLFGRWLSSGTHVNAIGANYEYRRELDTEAVARAAVIATDDQQQVQYEASDLSTPVKEGYLKWEQVKGLGEIVSGQIQGRSAENEITLFKSLGVAIEDVALAVRAYEKALDHGNGEVLPNLAG